VSPLYLALLLLVGMGLQLPAAEDDWLVPLGLPPRAAPRHISGGEGVPPLPLPATPLRRTERKRVPSPPTFIGKVVWGESGEYRYADGQTAQVADWNLCPDDLAQLMRKAGRWFGIPYGSQPVSLSSFNPDPAETPALFFSGVRTLRLTADQLNLLRSYIAQGGMAIFDSIAGSPYFHHSARAVAQQLIPNEPIRTVPLDHPIFHMMTDATTVAFPRNNIGDKPLMEAIYLGSRIACLISPYGLGCGWDDHEVPILEQATFYDADSANRLGINIVAYGIGYAAAARLEAKPETFGLIDEATPTDELVFAQIRHPGAWNVHPGAATALLRRLRRESPLRVSLKREAVTPGQDDLSPYVMLYLEGLDTFTWDEPALTALRQFIARGGTLIVNNGLGLSTFDTSARTSLNTLLPNTPLTPLDPQHPLFTTFRTVDTITASPALRQRFPELTAPSLEGVVINGDLRIIYSRFDLAAAWLGCDYPLALCYSGEDAINLGMNILIYTMTH